MSDKYIAPEQIPVGYYPIFVPSIPQTPAPPDPEPERALPRMRTIRALAKECRENGLDITEHFIRKLCLEGKICFVKAGSKYLVNYDRFIDYLNGELMLPEPEPERGVIRPIPENLKRQGLYGKKAERAAEDG